MYECFCLLVPVSVCTVCMPLLKKAKKKALDPLELELWVVRHHVDAGSRIWVLC